MIPPNSALGPIVPAVVFGLLLLSAGSAAAAASSAVSSLSDLPFDSISDRLSTHLLVYPDACSDAVEAGLDRRPPGRECVAVSGEARAAFFGDAYGGSDRRLDLGECGAVCVERGVRRSLVRHVAPEYRFDGGAAGGVRMTLDKFVVHTCQAVEFAFINYHDADTKKAINLYWVKESGERVAMDPVLYGEENTRIIRSFLGHRFLFEDPDTGEVLLEHVIEFSGARAVGQYPSLVDPTKDMTNAIKSTLRSEWDRHLKVKRTFTPLGFGLGRLPEDLFAPMDAFNYNNNDYRVLEEWNRRSKGPYVNWWEADVFFIQVPTDLKLTWQTRIKDLVEAWAGVELENTSMYGLRRYEEGARLLTHVDRVSTHAASVIINVAQGNVTEPWAVELYDHADRLHEVIMEPGDIVYYESAKCLHGRNVPLRGEGAHYVNMFSHYRPTGDPDWYTRPNPEGTPEPLMDVGECRPEGGAVRCDDPRVGPHLSPSLEVARSGGDLFEWWLRTGEETGDVDGEGECERHEEL